MYICIQGDIKNCSMTLVQHRRLYSREAHHNRFRNICNGVLECGRELGLNSEFSIGKWEFTAKKQGRGQRMEDY
jgi:hypothetical protein